VLVARAGAVRYLGAMLRLGLLLAFVSCASLARADVVSEESGPARRPEPAAEDELHFSVGLGAEYSQGDFGLHEVSRFAASTLRLRAWRGPWLLRLAVPYSYASGSPEVVGQPDAPTQTCDDGDNSGPGGGGDDACDVGTATARSSRRHDHGLGDVTLQVGYTIDPVREYLPYVELSAKAKFATASESRGLGTGRNDYTLQIDLDRSFGAVTPFAALGYRFVGDPTGVDLHDIWLASAGVSFDLGSAWTLGVAYDYREASARGADDSHELGPFATWRLSRHWRLGGYGSFGLSDGAPDYSAGTSVTFVY
jgi:opacity protein-like surface antigen